MADGYLWSYGRIPVDEIGGFVRMISAPDFKAFSIGHAFQRLDTRTNTIGQKVL